MLTWGVAGLLAIGLTVLLYGRSDLARAPWLLLLRWLGAMVVFAMLLDAPIRGAVPPRPVVALDVSMSWRMGGETARWDAARARTQAIIDSLGIDRGQDLLLVGDSVRFADLPDAPTDLTSRLRPLVEWALATGRPVHLVTDGRLDATEWASRLPAGSFVHRLDPLARAAAQLTALDAPLTAPAGDTLVAEVTITADALGAAPGQLIVSRDAAIAVRRDLEAMGPYETRVIPVAVPLPASIGDAVRLSVRTREGDASTDPLAVTVRLTGGAAAVALSTAPDQDARFAVAALRAVRRGPVRAYWQVAKGVWRVDGTLAPVEEAVVRRDARDAELLLLHGDSSVLGGAERARVRGLILMSPPPAGDEYYPVSPPRSPLADALSGVPWDSLPPLDVAPPPTRGDGAGMPVVQARRGRRFEARDAIRVTDDTARGQRVVRIPAAGFWRWKSRGGRSAESYDALVGALIDWAGSAEGTGADSVTRGEAAARALAMARRAELRPRAATLSAGPIGSGDVQGRALGARGIWWLAALALAAFSAEWILRRRRGLR